MFVCVIVESQDFDYHHQELEKKNFTNEKTPLKMIFLQFAFKVREGNFLDLLSHSWGIEVDIWKDKAKAILWNKTPTN